VDAAAGALFKSREEQRRAGRGVELEWFADVVALGGWVLLGGPLEDEDVVRLDQFLLYPGGGDEDMVTLADGGLDVR
jgi:hypothetical protein